MERRDKDKYKKRGAERGKKEKREIAEEEERLMKKRLVNKYRINR